MTNKKQLTEFNETGRISYANNQKSVLANVKAQKEAAEKAFKQNAREEALRAAKFIRINDTSDKILKDADKIYQWLIKKIM